MADMYNPMQESLRTIEAFGQGGLQRGLQAGQFAQIRQADAERALLAIKKDEYHRAALEYSKGNYDPIIQVAAKYGDTTVLKDATERKTEVEKAKKVQGIMAGVPQNIPGLSVPSATLQTSAAQTGGMGLRGLRPLQLGEMSAEGAPRPAYDVLGEQIRAVAPIDIDTATKLAALQKMYAPEKAEKPQYHYGAQPVKTADGTYKYPVMLEGKVVGYSGEREPSVGKGGKGGDGEGFKDAKDLRSEYISQSKNYMDVRDSYARMQEASKIPSAAGDVAIIFSYMRMLDPTSTVREGEFATAANTGSVPDRITAMYNKALSGERLADTMRADFVNNAQKIYKRQETQHSGRIKEYTRLAKKFGVDPETVIVDFSDPTAAATAGGTAASKFWKQ